MAHLISNFDRKQSALQGWMRLANYPVGIAGASIGTWVSQNSPTLYNKVFIMGIFFSSLAVVIYQVAHRIWAARREAK
jgi:hypothetical protein